MKTEKIIMRATPELKAAVKELADKEHRSLTNYIESVLWAEVARKERDAA